MPKIYLNTQEAAEYLGVCANTLERWRMKGIGPKYYRDRETKKVRYTIAWIDEYVKAHVVEPAA